MDVHLIVNAYDKNQGRPPFRRWAEDGLFVYGDEKQIPAFNRASGLRLPRVSDFRQGYGRKIHTQRDLVKHRSRNVSERTEQTETAALRRWFGESRVVDENGEPLVVYHGTGADFSQFETPAFFTEDPEIAGQYASGQRRESSAENVMPAYLRIENPVRIEDFQDLEDAIGPLENLNIGAFDEVWEALEDQNVIDELQAAGYDGVDFRGDASPDFNVPHRSWVAFRPEQVKSATGNTGAFDPENPDIRYSRRRRDDEPEWSMSFNLDPESGKMEKLEDAMQRAGLAKKRGTLSDWPRRKCRGRLFRVRWFTSI